jgi:hypothetical protein
VPHAVDVPEGGAVSGMSLEVACGTLRELQRPRSKRHRRSDKDGLQDIDSGAEWLYWPRIWCMRTWYRLWTAPFQSVQKTRVEEDDGVDKFPDEAPGWSRCAGDNRPYLRYHYAPYALSSGQRRSASGQYSDTSGTSRGTSARLCRTKLISEPVRAWYRRTHSSLSGGTLPSLHGAIRGLGTKYLPPLRHCLLLGELTGVCSRQRPKARSWAFCR